MEITPNIESTLAGMGVPESALMRTGGLQQQDFLKLMIEQLRNQNPLSEPEGGGLDFFAQIVQFDTLESMRSMVTALDSLVAASELANASALLGRTVTALIVYAETGDGTGTSEPETISGQVERVTFGRDGAVVHVGGFLIPAAMIVEVAP